METGLLTDVKNPCKRMTVQAIGIDMAGNRVKATNYNTGECTNIPGACGCKHAEIALLEEMPNPLTIVLSHSPCINCAKAIVEAGVQFIMFKRLYRLRDGIEYLEQNGVRVYRI